MLPLVCSLGLAAGVYLIYDGLTRPAAPEQRVGLAERIERWLRRAGVQGVAARDFALASLGAGLAGGVLAELWLGLPVVSVGVAALGAALPGPSSRPARNAARPPSRQRWWRPSPSCAMPSAPV